MPANKECIENMVKTIENSSSMTMGAGNMTAVASIRVENPNDKFPSANKKIFISVGSGNISLDKFQANALIVMLENLVDFIEKGEQE